MRDPRWITTMFDLCVRVVGAGRFTRAFYPVLTAFITCTLVLMWPERSEPSIQLDAWLPTLSEVRLSLESSAPLVPAAVVAAPAVVGSPDAVSAPQTKVHPLKLNKEQTNLAQFIATRYRVALDNTQMFVDGAYKAAREYKMDPWLLLAVMAVESSFDPDATSNRGAHGLMQVLTRVHADKFAPFGGVTAAFDPSANIRVGARILRDYIIRDGSVEGGLKAYVGAALMDDDRGYGWRVLAERDRLAAVAAGKPVPELKSRPSGPAEVKAVASSDGTAAKARADDPTGQGNRTKDVILELLGTVTGAGAPIPVGVNSVSGLVMPAPAAASANAPSNGTANTAGNLPLTPAVAAPASTPVPVAGLPLSATSAASTAPGTILPDQ